MSVAVSLKIEPNHPEVERAYADASPFVVAEILHGNVMMSPRPAPKHSRAAKKLWARLFGPFDEGVGGPGGWVFIDEPELHLGARPDKMQPDLSGWLRPRLPAEPGGAAISVAPDWICERVSPSTEVQDRGVKVPLYAEHGVSSLWLLDPVARVIEGFALDRGVLRLRGTWRGDGRARIHPFDAIELDLATLWVW